MSAALLPASVQGPDGNGNEILRTEIALQEEIIRKIRSREFQVQGSVLKVQKKSERVGAISAI
jgi:hypothetical protein